MEFVVFLWDSAEMWSGEEVVDAIVVSVEGDFKPREGYDCVDERVIKLAGLNGFSLVDGFVTE